MKEGVQFRQPLRFRWSLLFSFLAGAALPLGFAPVDFWPLTFLSPAVLLLLLAHQPIRRAVWLGYAFGLGQFGVGVSWVYLSLTQFGGAVAPLAALITLLFFGVLAIYPALMCGLAAWGAMPQPYRVPQAQTLSLRLILSFAGSWVFIEWIRGWVLSGFPWLDLGVAQINSPLVGFLPLIGEYGVSFIVVLMAGSLAWATVRVLRPRQAGVGAVWMKPVLAVAGLYAGVLAVGGGLSQIHWTQPVGKPLLVGLAQANVPQMQKFDPAFLNQTLHTYMALTDAIGKADLIIWPETAIPDVLDNLDWFRQILEKKAEAGGFSFLVGTFTQDGAGHYYNSLVGIPQQVGGHRKAHLVPFSEYMPFRPLMNLFSGLIDIPMSDLTPGSLDQPLPEVQGIKIGASICYEADFARDIRHSLPAAGFLVNVSNDSWFGDSLAPHQNLQMAAVRALEFGRPMVRATNTGISAFISAQGQFVHELGVNQQGILKAEVQPYGGSTPFYRIQSWPIILLSLLLWLGAWFVGYRNTRR